MIINDLHSFQKFVAARNRATTTGNANGTSIDAQGFQALDFIIPVDTVTTADASNFLTLSVQWSDDNSTWTNLTDTNNFGEFHGTPTVIDGVNVLANTIQSFGISRLQHRYYRIVITATGTTSSAFSVIAQLSNSRHAPTSLSIT